MCGSVLRWSPSCSTICDLNDILLTLGAGDVWQIGEAFLHATGEA